MKTRIPVWWVVVVSASCAWPHRPRPVLVENDTSIVFPSFFASAAVDVGAGGAPSELDGVVLRAIMIAANDFLPPGDASQPCWDRQEAYRYRVIRQGDIIFVRIIEDLEHCGSQYVSVDTGAKYAISIDGRILRRLIGAEPEGDSNLQLPDAGHQGTALEQHDGGTPLAPSHPTPLPTAPDGGSPGKT
ncbi:MAG: hypothetical protein JXB05_23885 [Myxococcaceae bacterium]|nr:hypothetical protein [Myxococcaceae bacterium]